MAKKNTQQPQEQFKTMIGGQALIEGIMMLGPEKSAVVVRTKDGLQRKVEPRKLSQKWSPKKLPFIRGIFNFCTSMKTGVSALMYSADFFAEEDEDEKGKEPGRFEAWLEKRLSSEKAQNALITFSVVICIVLGGLMSLVAHLFPQIYNTSDSIRGFAASFIRICALCMPINALANACYFTLRSGGKTFVTFLFDSFYVCVLTVPMAFVLSRFTGLPIVPLFLCCQLADIGKCVVGLIMIRRGVWIQNIVGKEAA